MNLTEPIRRQAELAADTPAIAHPDGRRVSYRELDRTIDALAQRLLDLGLAPGNTVGMFPLRPYPYVVLRLALARVGITGGHMTMSAALMDVCFTNGGTPPIGRVKMVTFDPSWVDAPPADAAVPSVPFHVEGATIAGVFPSSGTTGSPRFVALSCDTIMRRIQSRGRNIPLPAEARQISMIGPGTLFGFSSILRVLWSGGLAVLESADVATQQLLADIERHRVNHMVMSPMTLERLASSVPPGSGPLSSLESIEVSGSHLPIPLYELARQRVCPNIISSYGGTESGHVASAPMSALRDHPGAVGYLHPGVEVQAVDADGVPLPPGQEGILRVRSANAATTYIGNPEASAGVFKDGWVYPGDMGTVSADGLLSVVGRAGELINSGGNKVHPQVIEDVLLSFPGIREAAAFGVPDALGLTRIWAAMVVDRPVDAGALHALCKRRLGMVAPKHVMRMDSLPRTETGKILRSELARIAASTYGDKLSV
jgi:acyl-coenzyme A synthetase/AMP-(fatty) acid ligase